MIQLRETCIQNENKNDAFFLQIRCTKIMEAFSSIGLDVEHIMCVFVEKREKYQYTALLQLIFENKNLSTR